MVNDVILSQTGVNYILLSQLKKDKGLSFPDMEKLTGISESTIKNVFFGKTRNPGMESLIPICRVLGIPVEIAYECGEVDEIKRKIEFQGIKEEDASIIALKEIYERQIAMLNATNEAHINNIRSHYEQHHEDLKDNYEKRLADKREIIDSLQGYVKSLKKECLSSRVAFWICCIILVGILVLEVANPNLGWIKF